MTTYTPSTALEAAVLKSGRFEVVTDSGGRPVVCAGYERLPRVVLPAAAQALAGLLGTIVEQGATTYTATAGDPWQIEADAASGPASVPAAEEYLVMSLRPLKLDGLPARVVSGNQVVRLFLLPWTRPAKTLHFGHDPHVVVTSTRSVVGEWVDVPDGRRGVVVGLADAWVGALESEVQPGCTVAFRCDVPVPWMGNEGLSKAVPSMAGAYEVASRPLATAASHSPEKESGSWVATLPVAMTEGNVVRPVLVPGDLEAEEVADGPWETEWHSATEFSMSGLN